MGLTGPVQPNDIVMRASEIGTTIPGIASLAMKSARKGAQRGVQGIYQLPSGQEPTPEFMNVAQQGLNNQTQQMTDMLNMMAPEDEQLAYINEEEAGILKLLGGSGEMTPQGIPTYRGHIGGSDHNSGGGGNTGQGGQQREREKQKQAEAAANEAAANAREQARAASVQAAAEQKEQDRQRREESANAGNEMSELDKMAEAEDNVNKENVDKYNSQEQIDRRVRDREIMDAGAGIEAGDGYLTGGTDGGLVAAGGALDSYRDNKRLEQEAEERLQSYTLANMDPQARSMLSNLNRTSYADAGNLLGSISDTDLDMSRDMINDRRNDLLNSKGLNIAELNELGQINQFMGDDVTEGMSLGQELKHKFTNDEFKNDLSNLVNNPVLGFALKGPAGLIGPGFRYAKSLYDKQKPSSRELSFVDGRAVFIDKKTGKVVAGYNPETGKQVEVVDSALDTAIDKGVNLANKGTALVGGINALQVGANILGSDASLLAKAGLSVLPALQLNKSALDFSDGKYGYDVTGLPGKLKDSIFGQREERDTKTLGSFDQYGVSDTSYNPFGKNALGEDRSNTRKNPGGDPANNIYNINLPVEDVEEVGTGDDRFQRAFANRYFTGPASLDEVRRYATEGGYSQLTPFSGREV